MESLKEVLKKLKKDISIVFKNIKELGKAFSQPVEEEQDFENLAKASNMTQKDIDDLKLAMEGVKDFKFAHESEEVSKEKNKKAIQPQRVNQVQQQQRNMPKEKTVEHERD